MSHYLSDSDLEWVMEVTELSLDELEHIVGRFGNNSIRAGKLRGELVFDEVGTPIIRHHFNKKVLWRFE